MALIEANWRPTTRQLRQFGVACLVAFPLLGWIWGAAASVLLWLVVAGAACALVGFVFPKLLVPLFVGITAVTLPIGIVVGELGLLFLYFFVLLPIGLTFRLLGRDPLEREADPEAESYWRARGQGVDPASYYRQH